MGQYRYPLYCFLRRKGLQHCDAEDVLHDFLAYLLKQGGLDRADARTGRLRSYLSVGLLRILNNWHRSESRRQRGLKPLPGADQDLSRYEEEQFASDDSPESVYEKQWAIELISSAFNRIAAQSETAGRAVVFAALSSVLLGGGTLHEHETEKIAAELSLNTGAVRTALSRLRADFRHALRAEVRETVAHEQEIDGEIEHLFTVFAAR